MKQVSLEAELRGATGKGTSRKLRAQGLIPAILYGKEMKEPQPLSINAKALRTTLVKAGSTNVLIDLALTGGSKKADKRLVMLKDHQIDALTNSWIHADFVEVRLDQAMNVTVPLHYAGKAKGLIEGGIVEIKRRHLAIRCLPNSIPSEIEVDISGLEVGDNLHVSDINIPEGVEVEDEMHLTLVTVVIPAKEEEVAAEAEVAVGEAGVVETPTEGEATPAAETEAKPTE